MKIKRILALLLTVLMVLSSVPMVTLSAAGTTIEGDSMIHLTDNGTRFTYFAKAVDLVGGETYVFTFRHFFEKGQFCFGSDEKGGLALDLFFLGDTGTLMETNRGTRRNSDDGRRFGYEVVDAKKGIVSFTFTVEKHMWDQFDDSLYPAKGETKTLAIGFTTAQKNVETDIYMSDFTLYNKNDSTKTNIFGEDTGDLTGWYSYARKDSATDNEFEGFDANGALSGTTYQGGVYHAQVEVLPFDESVMTIKGEAMAEPTTAPERMLHHIPFEGTVNGENGNALLGGMANVSAGATYFLSFHMATNANPSAVQINGWVNNSRTDLKLEPQLLEMVEHPTYFWATYKITIPDSYEGEGAAIGFSIPVGKEAYIFDINLYDPVDTEKTNMLNLPLDTLSGVVYGKYLLWGGAYAYHGTLSDGDTKYVVENNTGSTEVMDYDESAFLSITKMLYFKYESAQLLQTRISVVAGAEYKMSFDVTNSVTSVGVEATTGSNRYPISINSQLVESDDKGLITHYAYTFKIPEDYKGEDSSAGTAFIGISFGDGNVGYLMNVKLTRTDDTTAKNLIDNAGFTSALDHWSYGWDAWFGILQSSGCTEWSKNNELRLKVVNYDESLFEAILTKKMLHYSGTVSGADMSYIGQKITLEKGKTYNIAFNYKIKNGGLDDTFYVAIANLANDRIGDILYCNKNVDNAIAFTGSKDDAKKTANYSFTFDKESGEYAFVLASWDKTNLTDVYISNFNVYDVTDAKKKSVLSKTNYSTNVSGYYSTENVSDSTALSWTQQGYTIKYENYRDSYFLTDKTMLYFKEYKERGQEIFVQKLDGLKANVEYTASFDYHIKGGLTLDETSELFNSLFFSLYAGTNEPGAGQTFDILLRSNSGRVPGSAPFTSKTDDGYTITYTFTLTESEVAGKKLYAGFYLMPDPDLLTELYIADLTIYETADANKRNQLLSDEYETWVDNWVSYWGTSLSGNRELYSRPEIEYTACYVPYDETLFKAKEAVDFIYGDSNDDGIVNILDLVNIKKKIANNTIFTLADIDKNGILNALDVTAIRKHILGVKTIPVESTYVIDLMDDFNLVGGAEDLAAEYKDYTDTCVDTVIDNATGTVYYVAADGKSSNSGTTPNDPINVGKVNSLSLKAGDAVVFKRGDTFRISSYIELKNNVAYGAYGDGDDPRPEILGSLKNYADSSLWTSTDNKMWKISLGTSDAANVIFNDGEAVGFRKATLADVKTDGDFYYDQKSKILYMYLYNQNPGNYFDSIEIASTNYLFYCYGAMSNIKRNVTVENITLKYATTLGMHFAFIDGFKITGCEIGWIGGAYFNNGERYGNGIQFWRYANDCTVSDNYIYQIYDAAISFQGTTDNDYTDLYFMYNLIEYCSMNYEFWGTDEDTSDTSSDLDATMRDVYFNYNVLRFGGYGFGGLQRKGKLDQGYILTWNYTYNENQIDNVTVQYNTFDIANCNYIYSTGMSNLIDINANTYYQNANSSHPVIRNGGTYAKDLDSFTKAITSVDAQAELHWVE